MKKSVRKLAAVGLTITSVVSLVACGNSASSSSTSKTNSAEITKPESIRVMVDGTVVTEANGGQAFYDYLKGLTGIDVVWVRPDHSGYYDAVGQAFNSESDMPDILVLSSEYYAVYAANGLLWDMTDTWNNSEIKNSGRLISTADKIFDSLMVNGADGKKALYGFATGRGNGCCTYVKETWLKAAGYSKADIENKTLTFNDYYAMLKKMQEVTGKNVISSAGFIGPETPYTNYLPEFYQQANYTFYKNASGQYVDGFSEKAMADALTRIHTAVADGVLDQESVNNSTANARDKFYADNTGVFTYWAGDWANTLKVNLAAKGQDDSLVAINPIKELGTYVERVTPCWAITAGAKNPEGIFTYWLSKMLDGGDIQTAWTYGAKGTHWDTVAETVTLQGKENEGVTYAEGTFHMLPSPEKPNTMSTKNNINPLLTVGTFTNGDPGAALMPQIAQDNMDFFAANSTVAVPLPMTDAIGDNIGDINTERNLIIASVATGKMTADEGMKEYNTKVGALVDLVLKSLNK